jgi:hypothetical protein
MSEPGLSLSRLIAAERNALAAIETSKNAQAVIDDLRTKVSRLEASAVQMSQRIDEANRNAALARAGH